MIRYVTNWMGPINLAWIKEHGDYWCAGRIDIYGTGDDYPDEIALPMMHREDWHQFSQWLHDYSSDAVCSLKELVLEYEKTNTKIRWFHDEDWLGV